MGIVSDRSFHATRVRLSLLPVNDGVRPAGSLPPPVQRGTPAHPAQYNKLGQLQAVAQRLRPMAVYRKEEEAFRWPFLALYAVLPSRCSGPKCSSGGTPPLYKASGSNSRINVARIASNCAASSGCTWYKQLFSTSTSRRSASMAAR